MHRTMFHLWTRLCCHASLFTPITRNERPAHDSKVSGEPHFSLQTRAFVPDLWGRREFKEHRLFETIAYSRACRCRGVHFAAVMWSSPLHVQFLFYMRVYKIYNHVSLSFRVKWSFQTLYTSCVYMQPENALLIPLVPQLEWNRFM